jgi:hypothetical protein
MLAAVKRMKLKRRQSFICALICAAVVAIPTGTEAEVANSPFRNALVEPIAAGFCWLRSSMQSIDAMRSINLRFDGDPVGAEPRQIELYAVGYTQERNLVLFGRQVKGYSESTEGLLPAWRSFRVDRIKVIDNALGPAFNPMQPSANDYSFVSEFICKSESVR